jgi:N-sulfoglucosamine sulfohydrolase
MKIFLLMVMSAGLCSVVPAVSASAKPNLVLVIADDLGIQLGCYGDKMTVTPRLDRLAAEGVRFANAHVTAASCSPSRGSMFTGLYPHQHGMFSLCQNGWADMHPDVPVLPNALKALGYRTGIIGKAHHGEKSNFIWDFKQGPAADRDVRRMNAGAGDFLDSVARGEPFFLVMSYVDPHRGGGRYGAEKNKRFPRQMLGLPENPPTPEETIPVDFLAMDGGDVRIENSDFYAALSRVDTGVGEFLDLLAGRGLADNTLVLFIGDHGPDLTRGKISAYAPATHIPFLVRWPGRATPGLVREELVSTIDIFPTFLAAAGSPDATPDARQQGFPLQPLLEAGPVPWREVLFTEFIAHVPWNYYPRHTVFDGRFHLIDNTFGGERKSPMAGGSFCEAWWEAMKPEYEGTPIRATYDRVTSPPRFELFDLSNDPFELANLADDPAHAADVRRLAAAIASWRESTSDPFLDPAFAKNYEDHVGRLKAEFENRSRKPSKQADKNSEEAL